MSFCIQVALKSCLESFRKQFLYTSRDLYVSEYDDLLCHVGQKGLRFIILKSKQDVKMQISLLRCVHSSWKRCQVN